MTVSTRPIPSKTESTVDSKPPSPSELTLTHKPLPGEGATEWLNRLARTLQELDATIAHLLVFGSLGAHAPVTEALRRVFGAVEWPVTWVEGGACDGSPIAGAQVVALAGGNVQPIRLEGRVVGAVFDDGALRHCLLGGLGPDQREASRADQARQTFDQLQQACAQAGLALSDLVRTWFFLDNLHAWYGNFNQVRTALYSRVKFRSGSLPASTGVGGRNPDLAALTVAAWGVLPLAPAPSAAPRPDASKAAPPVSIREIGSPLQCPAPSYGSSFSRAMEIASPSGRRLTISGTASISQDGRTLWLDDTRSQVALTMEVVDAILRSRGYSLRDITRAVAYFKHAADAPVFEEWCVARGQASMPVIPAQCAVCREDLLFELEADAYRPA
jgi:enamine deaminase RidA (YjgF/YER057c/UK114 family)